MRTLILDTAAIDASLKRMAWQVYEHNFSAEDLVILGVDERGTYLARELMGMLQEISPLKIRLLSAELDRKERQGRTEPMQVSFSEGLKCIQNKTILVVDDVLYSGNTLMHVLNPLLVAQPNMIQTAILIDRGHRSMPIASNFTGVELATTLQQFVAVEIDEDSGDLNVYLE